jgi:hypothetical protein
MKNTDRLCLFKSLEIATLETNASSPPFMASTGIYHTQAVRTLGALVDMYCGGRRIRRKMEIYAKPNVTKMVPSED